MRELELSSHRGRLQLEPARAASPAPAAHPHTPGQGTGHHCPSWPQSRAGHPPLSLRSLVPKRHPKCHQGAELQQLEHARGRDGRCVSSHRPHRSLPMGSQTLAASLWGSVADRKWTNGSLCSYRSVISPFMKERINCLSS